MQVSSQGFLLIPVTYQQSNTVYGNIKHLSNFYGSTNLGEQVKVRQFVSEKKKKTKNQPSLRKKEIISLNVTLTKLFRVHLETIWSLKAKSTSTHSNSEYLFIYLF